MAANGEVIRHNDNIPSVDRGVEQSDAMGTELARTAEAGTAQLEASAIAEVKASYYLAKQYPRNWDQVEQRLRKECRRPGFANSAWWVLPLGGDPKKYPAGLSIRFAESALRMATNIDVQQMVVRDDQWQRIVRIRVKDLEGNFGYTSEVIVDKTVERSDPKGREVINMRQNSYGKMTYVVAATEQEIALKQGSAVSKAIRTNGLRLIPGDILDEAKQIILATRSAGAAAEDPELARKSILDNFAEISIMPTDIAKLVEHDTGHFLPADRELLRGVYAAIKNGVATWKEVMEAKFGPAEGADESDGAKKVREAIAKRQQKPSSTAPAASTAPADSTVTASKDANPANPSATTASGTALATQTTQPETVATVREYDEFPDPMADGTVITVKGVRYHVVEGNWRPVNPAGSDKPKRQRNLMENM